ncbi:MAG: serine/threonine-protein kinase [Kiritimatiellia bacterium]
MTDDISSDSSHTVVLRPEGDSFAEVLSSTRRSPSDDYAICGKVGDGGMGVVYLAKDRRLGRYVAIKRLNDKSLADPILKQRFLHEARAVAALNHAYIVHIYALGEDELGPYIVMEYVSGPAQTEIVPPTNGESAPPKNLTLENFINKNGPMTADEAVTMILKIARTMVYAHSCGVIHRDLKPANILLDPSYEPKLVDFGLARLAPRDDRTRVEDLTVPGEKLISLGYSAPELEQDASTSDGRADIYSLGAILYFLLTGRNPRYYREQDVPTFLREVMRRSLETVREQRYRTAQDFVRALTEAASHGKIVAPTVKTTWRCKWCDAVNPVSTKFCAECGWDGSEKCLECGAETFVGQQYCSSCGADCRMYEHVDSIVNLIHQAWDERHFERISTIAGRLHGFEPAGSTGRKILTEAHENVEEAERKVARRNRLSTLIPNELKAENYERALAFIEEFRTLNEDPFVYEEELKTIPTLILNRDLVRIRQCIRKHDWMTARLLTSSLAAKYGNVPEYEDVRQRLFLHERRRKRLRWIWGIALLLMLYLGTLPPAARLSGGTLKSLPRTLYTPARLLLKLPGIRVVADRYAAIFKLTSIEACFPNSSDSLLAIKTTGVLPDGADLGRKEFEAQLSDIEVSRKQLEVTLLVQYRQFLADLRHRRQQAGDYDDVVACDKAIATFNETNCISAIVEGDPQELTELNRRFDQLNKEQATLYARQITGTVKKYSAALDDLRKGYTQRGEMVEAGQISDEIQRAKQLPSVVTAEKLLAAGSARGDTLTSLDITNVPSIAEIDQLRLTQETLRKTIEELDRKANETLRGWPEQYIAALKMLMEQYRLSGNFNAWEAASSELTRFEDENTLRAENIVDYPEGLRQNQQTFLQRITTTAEERNAAARIAYSEHIRQLEEKKVSLTKKGAMDSAAAVNLSLRHLYQSSDYLSAFGRPPLESKTEKTATKKAPPSSSVPAKKE